MRFRKFVVVVVVVMGIEKYFLLLLKLVLWTPAAG